MTGGRVDQVTIASALRDHLARIRALEALGPFLQFDYDNEGGWLDITTNAVDPGGFGMHFKDLTDGGMLFETRGTHGGMTFNEVSVDGGQFFEEFGDGGQWFFNTGSGPTFMRQSGGGDFTLTATGGGHLRLIGATSGSGGDPTIELGGSGDVSSYIDLHNTNQQIILSNAGILISSDYTGTGLAGIDIRLYAGGAPGAATTDNFVALVPAAVLPYFTTKPNAAGASAKIYAFDGGGGAGTRTLEVIFADGTRKTIETD